MKRHVWLLLLGFVGSSSWAHGGGLDRYGCHHDRKNGGYHCHGGAPSSSGSPSRSTAKPRATPSRLLDDRYLTPAQRREIAGDKPLPSVTGRSPFIPITPNPPTPLYNSRLSLPIIGQAKIIDGDTFEIGGLLLGLYGVDASEPEQRCGFKVEIACGANATEALRKIINGIPLTCVERASDRRGRTLVACRRLLGDINAEMVRTGWAVADRAASNEYTDDENIAIGGKAGAWIGPFQWPWEARGELREASADASAATAGAGCVFKAHINSRGEKVYYVPADAAYDGVRPDALFCSERLAILAGYLRPFR